MLVAELLADFALVYDMLADRMLAPGARDVLHDAVTAANLLVVVNLFQSARHVVGGVESDVEVRYEVDQLATAAQVGSAAGTLQVLYCALIEVLC